jgi:hypothetical protein
MAPEEKELGARGDLPSFGPEARQRVAAQAGCSVAQVDACLARFLATRAMTRRAQGQAPGAQSAEPGAGAMCSGLGAPAGRRCPVGVRICRAAAPSTGCPLTCVWLRVHL